MLKEIKKTATTKFSQGDLNIYALKQVPDIATKPFRKAILVTGNGGNNHRLTGKGYSVGQTDTGQFVVEVASKGVTLAHEQHKPAIKLAPGVYLVDRVLEKGMFNDMITPVVD